MQLPPKLGLFILSAALLIGGLSSCGSSGSSSGISGPASADFLIQDAAADDLSSFTATVSELRLLDPLGAASANLLAGNVDIEFLGLQQTSAWLASLQPPMGTWRSVRVNFVPGSVVARAGDGSLVAVTEAATVLNADFSSDLVVGAAGYQLVQIDLNLASSLSGDVAAPPIVFSPAGTVMNSTGSSSASIDEIKGIVQSLSPGSSSLTLDAFVDDDQTVALGTVNVRVSGATLLLMENGTAFPSTATFFAALATGQTFLEVHGNLLGGNLAATRIEIEDQNGGANSTNVVEIEGRIVGLNSGSSTLTLLIQEIEKGQAIAGPVLAGLGNPGTIQVSWDPMTLFLDDDTNQMLTSAALAVGLEVDTKFPMFASQPFAATEIEIEDLSVEYEGFIQDVSGLPNSMVVRLKSSDPAVLSGLVASSSTDVLVDMTGAPISLDVNSEPTLVTGDLQAGLRLDLYGTLGGSAMMPTLDATRIEIEPGEFDGDVMSVNQGLSFFQAGVNSIDDPFGASVSGGPLDVVIHPTATFEGAASNASQFFSLFANLTTGETLDIEVEGIGSPGTPNEVVAYEIEVEVN